MVLAVLGLNHKTVSVDIREKFSISEESAQEGLLHLSEQEGIKRRRLSFLHVTAQRYMLF